VLAGAAGLLHAASIAPQPLAALNVLALLALCISLHGAAPRRAALLGWTFATCWLTASVWWLFISLHRYGELPAWLAAAAVLSLAACLGGYTALACAGSVWATRRSGAGPGRAAMLFAAAWLLAELARAQWFTGFPWAAAGDAHVDGLLAQLAPWVGVYGIGAVAAGIAAGLAGLLRPVLSLAWHGRVAGHDKGEPASSQTRRAVWLPVGAAVVCLVLLQWPVPPLFDFTRPAGHLSVTLLQGNVAQDEKFDPSRVPVSLAWHLQRLLEARSDLVMAPETAIPLLAEDLPAGYWASLREHFDTGEVSALFGLPMGDASNGYTNSALGLAPGAAPYRYDKHHLVPFGEFIPLGFRWFVDLMRMPLGDFRRGALVAPSFVVKGLRVAPNICYEDLFGEDLAARFADPEQAPHVLANLSNIGWFGQSIAVQQHLQISRLRALELQRPMLRATNTGATVIIDHRGVVTHALAPHQAGELHGEVQGRSGNTPFANWTAWGGLWPLWLLGVVVLLVAGRRRRA
jgi:apolipoprotein N-acyltransferase